MAKKREDYESWLQHYWRPMMAVAYIVIILFDFMIAPILWGLLQAFALGTVTLQWSPLTLLSGGLFHATMGVVLGITAYSRGKEKIEKMRIESQKTSAVNTSEADSK